MQEVQCPATSATLRVSTLSYTRPERGPPYAVLSAYQNKNQTEQQLATETVSGRRETRNFTQWNTDAA
jgi:hypothetical protein